MTKTLFVVTAAIEAATGLALAASPSLAISLLFDSALETPTGSVFARIAGAALISLGTACWLARLDDKSPAAHGLIAAMLLYNTATVALLIYAGIGLDLLGVGLWPGVALHTTMTAWCVACLWI